MGSKFGWKIFGKFAKINLQAGTKQNKVGFASSAAIVAFFGKFQLASPVSPHANMGCFLQAKWNREDCSSGVRREFATCCQSVVISKQVECS